MKLTIGQEGYYVQQEKVQVIKVIAVITRTDDDGQTTQYEIQDYKGKNRVVSQAYLVSDWEVAKKASIENWNSIVDKVTDAVTNQPYISFEEAQAMYNKAKEKAQIEKEKT